MGEDPRAPLGHLSRLGFALRNAARVDDVAGALLLHLGALPGVSRVGLALSEGAGRRLRFVASDRAAGGVLDWCHIDAYDDAPLTSVVRDGRPVLGSLDRLEGRFPGVVAAQRRAGTRAIAAWPLPDLGSPLGGLVLFFDEAQDFPDAQQRLLEAAARRASEALRRVWFSAGREQDEASFADEVVGLGSGGHARELLDGTPLAPRAARGFLRRQLGEWGVDPEVLESAELALSELVTNAVMHARTSAEVTLRLDASLLSVAVRDRGNVGATDESAWPVEVSDVDDPLRVFGRGLALVEALVDRWGTERDATGTTAWFELQLGDADRAPRP